MRQRRLTGLLRLWLSSNLPSKTPRCSSDATKSFFAASVAAVAAASAVVRSASVASSLISATDISPNVSIRAIATSPRVRTSVANA